jgi:hypothetical protein
VKEELSGKAERAPWSLKRAFDSVVGGLTSKVPSRAKAAVSKIIAGHEQSNHDPGTMKRLQSDMEDIRDEVETAALVEAEAAETANKPTHYSTSGIGSGSSSGKEKVQRVSAKEGLRTPGQTALHIAAGKGDLKAVEMLLGHGEGKGQGRAPVDIHAKDSNDWQAVHEGALKGHLEVRLESLQEAIVMADCAGCLVSR